jgi:putative ABC transport system permease protein
LLQGYQISVDARVLLVTAGIAVVTAVVISLLPAAQQPERGLASALRDEGRSSSGSVSRQRARRTLVISEIALALVVATGAGLMVRSFLNARNVDPGFNPVHLVAFNLSLNDNRYPLVARVVEFEQSVVERLRALPGVVSVSAATAIPMAGASHISFSIEGRDLPKVPMATNTLVFPGYFETMQIPLRSGRAFTALETTASPRVAIINETLAREFFAGTNPVGKRIKWGGPTSPSPWATIVAVAADVKATALDSPEEPAVYFPALQSDTLMIHNTMRSMAYIVRTGGNPESVINAIRRTVREADAELPIVGMHTLEDIVSFSVAGRRFNTALLGAFAFLALVLAAVGIYGLMAYSVEQRTREIGIRLAIGATPIDVLRLVVSQAIRVASVGVVLGVVGSLLLTRVMTTLLFDVSPLDPLTFACAAGLLFGVAWLASYLPARRAARIDPQTAIRAE